MLISLIVAVILIVSAAAAAKSHLTKSRRQRQLLKQELNSVNDTINGVIAAALAFLYNGPPSRFGAERLGFCNRRDAYVRMLREAEKTGNKALELLTRYILNFAPDDHCSIESFQFCINQLELATGLALAAAQRFDDQPFYRYVQCGLSWRQAYGDYKRVTLTLINQAEQAIAASTGSDNAATGSERQGLLAAMSDLDKVYAEIVTRRKDNPWCRIAPASNLKTPMADHDPETPPENLERNLRNQVARLQELHCLSGIALADLFELVGKAYWELADSNSRCEQLIEDGYRYRLRAHELYRKHLVRQLPVFVVEHGIEISRTLMAAKRFHEAEQLINEAYNLYDRPFRHNFWVSFGKLETQSMLLELHTKSGNLGAAERAFRKIKYILMSAQYSGFLERKEMQPLLLYTDEVQEKYKHAVAV